MNEKIGIIIIQLIFVFFFVFITFFFIRQKRIIKYERRISRYGVDPLKDDSKSFLDIIYFKYLKLVKRISNSFKKSVFLSKKANKYDKYLGFITSFDNNMDFIVHKMFMGILFVFIVTFSLTLLGRVISFIEILFSFILGYYIIDIYLAIKNKYRVNLIEKEILKSIIIMNNAFKAGKSTLQAVKIASEDLPEPINYEFKRIYEEMRYGLSIEVVFERFAKRVKIEEAQYISSSLIILNKTGGNIVKVFSSIEKNLLEKKKLKDELKNLTASSNMLVKVLLVVPFVFVLLLYVLNPTYFDPFFESALGITLLILMSFIFLLYIWFLQKVMKVGV